MTNSALAEPLVGAQRPRILCLPDSGVDLSLGDEAVELAALAGLYLDEWQKFVLRHSLARRLDGKWAAFEIGLALSRQNGKGSILEARELASLYLLDDPLSVHSAHQFDTSLEAFRRLLTLIEQTPELDQRVIRVSRSHGEEGIELRGGARIRFRTRARGGGRGFSGQLVVFDEAMYLPEAMIGNVLPIVSAQPNPQVIYAGSAVDQVVHQDGLVFARVRSRGHAGDDPSLAWFEWSLDEANPSDVPLSVLNDPEAWAQVNPALGIRIAAEHIANEQRSMSARTFAVERLGIGDWPSIDGAGTVIDMELWGELFDALSKPIDPVSFSFDVAPDRSWSSIGAAGYRGDKLAHVEVIERARGTGWVTGRLVELVANHKTVGPVVCDAGGPAASLLPGLELAGVDVEPLSAREHAQACGHLFDTVEQRTLRHLAAPDLDAALRGATQRPLGEAWAWSRRSSAVDISPLVAATLALWGLVARAKPIYRTAGIR